MLHPLADKDEQYHLWELFQALLRKAWTIICLWEMESYYSYFKYKRPWKTQKGEKSPLNVPWVREAFFSPSTPPDDKFAEGISTLGCD